MARLSATQSEKASFTWEPCGYGDFILVLEEMRSSSADWTIAPPPRASLPFPCHRGTVGLSSHGPELSCGFIMGRDGKQNHCRMKDGEKGGKGLT